MTRLLVTGFGPFPRVPRNPSGLLARRVAGSRRLALAGIEARALVLATAYPEIGRTLVPALEASRFDAVLMLGVAGRRRGLSVEVQALNRASRLFPDATGRVAGGLALTPGSPLRRPTRAPAGAVLRALRGAGVPASLSRDAGRYLCNGAYHAALGLHPGALFLHIPMPRGDRPGDRRPSLVGMEAAIVRAALALAQAAQRSGASPRPIRARP